MSFPSHKNYEKKWYKKWSNSNSFTSNVKKDKDPYTIMMPPPNVTGSLHIGHALTFTLQDILIRYHRIQGFDALWQPGTDHAGIATQMVVERELEKNNISRRDIGRDNFLKQIWEWKNNSGNKISDQLKALGTSPDWDRERFTMDEGLSKAVRKVFIKLYNEGLIYKDKRLVNWDTKLLTAISDLEVEQKEMKSEFWYIKYNLEDSTENIIIATTRPETLIGDVAVAVNPNDKRYKKYIGKNVILPILNKKIPVIADDSTDKDKGTGAVKITPAHDFNDFEVGKRHNLNFINIFDKHGCLNKNAPESFQGLDRFDARKKILKILIDKNQVLKKEIIVNVVPHGDRSGTIIEPWIMDQWYINAKAMAKPAIEAVESGKTKFIPKNWDKTFFEWMKNIQPWCISRQLWWGHRIPAWYGPDKKVFVYESKNEAQKYANKFYKKKVELYQDEDVLDTWFSSALWPFSTLDWPEDNEYLNKYYPSNVLVTGFDIIFFWVARMMMMGIHFMRGVTPFKEVYIHALVRDEKGQKMSKSKGNVLDPLDLLKKYSADALRFTLCAMAAQGRDIKLSEERILGYRNFSTKIVNACKFLEINGCYVKQDYKLNDIKSPINLWIINKLYNVNIKIKKSVKNYKFNEYSDTLYQFTWRDFCDWYIEFIKAIINSKNNSLIKETKFVASYVMNNILILLNPIMPFITEELNFHFFKNKEMLITSNWPKIYKVSNFKDNIRVITSIINEIRAYRVKNDISFKDWINIFISSKNDKHIQNIKNLENILCYVGKVKNIIFHGNGAKISTNVDLIQVETVIVGIEKKMKIYSKAKIQKLIEQKTKFESDLEKIENIINNKSFQKKAPTEIIEKNKKTRDELKEKIEQIVNIINLK